MDEPAVPYYQLITRKDLLDDSNAAKDLMDEVKEQVSLCKSCKWEEVIQLMSSFRTAMRKSFKTLDVSKVRERWFFGDDPFLYRERWEKLFSDFCAVKQEKFDTSRASELYDSLKFSALHHRTFLFAIFGENGGKEYGVRLRRRRRLEFRPHYRHPETSGRIWKLSETLGGVAWPSTSPRLVASLRTDLIEAVQWESHIHTLVDLVLYAGFLAANTRTPELAYSSHITLLDPTAPDPLQQHLEGQWSPVTKPNHESSIDCKDGTAAQDDTLFPNVADPSTPSTPPNDEEPLAEYIDPPHPDLWIPFGCLNHLKDPGVSIPLQMRNDGSKSQSILMGSDHECQILVFGLGVGRYHCLLTLELGNQHDGTFRRQVVIEKIRTPISPPSLITTIWVGDEAFEVQNEMVLPPGGILQLGDGDQYVYDAPKFESLYSEDEEIYSGQNLNSTVLRVKRLSDKHLFVAKVIHESHIRMARTEIQVFKELGHHPGIVRFMETFFNFESKIHHLVLEAGSMDLYHYTLEKRSHAQDVLQANAPRWIKEITSGIEHIHSHGIIHRDIKPQNILAFVKSGRAEMKIADMGLAKRKRQPVTEQVDDTSVAAGESGSSSSLRMQKAVSRLLHKEVGRVPGDQSYGSRK
ncbi:hypothetical protein FRC01_011827 [Tulasnella sp. 417]|nr:hypothetical protein FRC01_011827 [Tulasnella sp. 417]